MDSFFIVDFESSAFVEGDCARFAGLGLRQGIDGPDSRGAVAGSGEHLAAVWVEDGLGAPECLRQRDSSMTHSAVVSP